MCLPRTLPPCLRKARWAHRMWDVRDPMLKGWWRAHRIYEESGMEVRFAIGEVPKEFKRQVAEEERNFGAFLHIPVKVGAARCMSTVKASYCPVALLRACVLAHTGQAACALSPVLVLFKQSTHEPARCRTTTRRWPSRHWRSGSWL